MSPKIRLLAASLAATAAVGIASIATPASGSQPNACQAKVAGIRYVRPANDQPCGSSERAVNAEPRVVIE
jgi:hypothetical protein